MSSGNSSVKLQTNTQIRPFLSQMVIAILIFISPFLVYLHIYEPEGNLRDIYIFGYHYVHGYEDDQFFLYEVFRILPKLLLFLVWYHTAKGPLKFFILFPLWVSIMKLLIIIVPIPFYQEFKGLIKVFTAILLGLVYIISHIEYVKQEIRRFSKLDINLFKGYQIEVFASIVLVCMPLYIRLWEFVPSGLSWDVYFFKIPHLSAI